MAIDIAILADATTGALDIGIDGADLTSTDDFNTSILDSLLVNKRAEIYEVADSVERRGWIGDLYATQQGFQVGSKLWLFEQKRLTQEIFNRLLNEARASLQWLEDDSFADRVTITGELTDAFTVTFTINVRVTNNVSDRYFITWRNTQNFSTEA